MRIHWNEAHARTLSPDAFRIGFTRQEVALLFGSAEAHAVPGGDESVVALGQVVLAPAAARDLADALARVVADHGASFLAIRKLTEEQKARTAAGPGGGTGSAGGAPQSLRLLKVLDGLPVEGVEHSVKLGPGRMLPNRFLVGIDTEHLPGDQLTGILQALQMPQEHLAAFGDQLPEANQVLFGYEESRDAAIYKVYLEFWDRIARRLRETPHRTDPALLHIGYKWDARDSRRSTVSRYVCYPMLSEREIVGRLDGIYPDKADRGSGAAVREVLRKATEKAGDGRFKYVEVGEPENPRNSFDLNLYEAEMRVCDIRPCLEETARDYGLEAESVGPLLDRMAGRLLGHIAGGVDRRGEDFLTVYYEV